MVETANYSAAIGFAQKALIVAAVVAVLVGGVIGGSAPVGAVLMALGITAIPAGLLGIVSNVLTKDSRGATQTVIYLVMLAIGVVGLIVFLAVRDRVGSPDIGSGFILIATVVVGLPGLAGTLAIAYAGRRARPDGE